MTKKIVVGAVFGVFLLAAVWFGYRWWGQRTPGDAPLVLYGNVDIREVDLAFRQSGRITRMAFDEGSAVKAGDVLAEMDVKTFKDALAAADAEILRAKAELDKLAAGNRKQDVARAEQSVVAAQAQLARADADLQRQTGLYGEGIASARTLEAARAARTEAAAQLASAQQALSLQREGSRREDIAAARARLAAAEAQRAQAQTALADTMLTAPAPAVVQTRVREPGSMVTSRETVYTLSLRDPVYVRAYVGEPQLGQAVQGRRVHVTASSIDKVYQGQIGFVSPRAEFTPKSVETADLRTDLVYRLRIVVLDADERLRQGMPVTVRFDSQQRAAR